MHRFFAKTITPYIPVLLFLFTSAVYISHLSPSVYGGDSGDFIAAILSFGVPHPSGYPLFMLLGIMANFLPFGITPAWKIGLVSVFASSATVALVYLLVHKLTKSVLLALLTATTLAFFYLFWLYAEIVEVFALNNLFYMLLLYLSVLYRQKLATKYLYIISFVLGLSFANHEITFLVIPSLFILVLSANWKVLLQWKTVLSCIGLFFIGLLPYIYIPIAASRQPAVNWDNASTLQNFLHLVLRADYSWSVSTNPDMLTRFLAVWALAQRLFVELTPAGTFIILLGMVELLRKRMFAVFGACFVGFFLTGPFYVLYGLTPLTNAFTAGVLERFYLIAALFLVLFLPFGIRFIVSVLDMLLKTVILDSSRLKAYHTLFSGIFFILPIMLFILNFQKTDLHNVWIGDNLGIDLLSPLPKKSFLILNTDNILFNTQYVQLGTHLNSGVVLDNLIYLPKHQFFLTERQKVPRKSLSLIDWDYETFLQIQEAYPIYAWTSFQLTKEKDKQFSWMPFGLGFRVVNPGEPPISEDDFLVQQERIWSTFHIPYRDTLSSAERGLTVENIPATYANGYANIALYLRTHYKDFEKAKEYYQKSIAIDSEFENGYLGIGYADAALHDCEGARQAFEKVLLLDPAVRQAYISLYVLGNTCLHDSAFSDKVAKTYTNLFKGSLQQVTLDAISSGTSSE
ncbi:MAG: DUF2723 domain-containing protein [Patescibacteria group bacterium]|nr:DUF2723 domain-containing protein [Patescibacteria group bacterium]MDE2590478.1 DUF2723 domain-containing protein [Patescibacteria group bacterium]